MTLKDTLQEVSVSLMRARCLMDKARSASIKPPGFSDLDACLDEAYKHVTTCLAWTPEKKK